MTTVTFSFIRAIGRNLGLSFETQCVKDVSLEIAFCRQCIFMTFFSGLHIDVMCAIIMPPPPLGKRGGGIILQQLACRWVGRFVDKAMSAQYLLMSTVDVDRCSLFSF